MKVIDKNEETKNMKKLILSLFILFTTTLVGMDLSTEVNNGSLDIETPIDKAFDTNIDNKYIENKKERERLFPLFRENIEAQNIQLPLPFGVSVMGNVANVETGGQGLDIDFGGGKEFTDIGLKVDGDLTAQVSGLMLDFYPFPFLNVFGYAAYIRTSGDLKIGFENTKMTSVNFGDDGQAYGLGMNLAGGYKNFFTGLNGSLSFSKMNKTGALKQTFIITPRIGIKNESNTFQLWAGLMYMNKNSELQGDMPADTVGSLPAFSYSLNLEGPETSPTIGFRYEPVEHFEIICEAFLARDFNGVNMRLAYRF